MKENGIEFAMPTEGKRLHTSLNLLISQADALSEIAEAKNMSKTSIIDEAIRTFLSKENETTKIDQMLSSTDGYWFERNLEQVTKLLPPDDAKKLLPKQKVHLYLKLKNDADRQRVFEALGLTTDLDEINTVNDWLKEVSKIQDGKLRGYNLNSLAHKVRAKLTPLQEKYLGAKLGKDSMEKLSQHINDKMPKAQIFKDNTEKSNSENPSLETVLEVINEPEKAWNALPEPIREQIREAIGNKQFELAKGLAIGAKALVKPR